MVIESILSDAEDRARFLEAVNTEEPQAVRDFVEEHISENSSLWAENSDS